MSPSSSSSSTDSANVLAVAAAGKTIAPATSCSWQQVTENGECSIEPRSCYDCLNTQVAGGQVRVVICILMIYYDHYYELLC